MEGGITAGCCLYGITLAGIPTLSPVTVVGIIVWWGWVGMWYCGMRWVAWVELAQNKGSWVETEWDA